MLNSVLPISVLATSCSVPSSAHNCGTLFTYSVVNIVFIIYGIMHWQTAPTVFRYSQLQAIIYESRPDKPNDDISVAKSLIKHVQFNRMLPFL